VWQLSEQEKSVGDKAESKYARRLKIKHQGNGSTLFIDEALVKIEGTSTADYHRPVMLLVFGREVLRVIFV
jgi:hypothetical protein